MLPVTFYKITSKIDTTLGLDGGGHIAHWIAFSVHTQQPQVRFLAFPKFFPRNFSEKKCLGEKIVDVARLIDSSAA